MFKKQGIKLCGLMALVAILAVVMAEVAPRYRPPSAEEQKAMDIAFKRFKTDQPGSTAPTSVRITKKDSNGWVVEVLQFITPERNGLRRRDLYRVDRAGTCSWEGMATWGQY